MKSSQVVQGGARIQKASVILGGEPERERVAVVRVAVVAAINRPLLRAWRGA